jgi:hypothetical protein
MRTDYSDQTRKGETQITRDPQPSTVVVQPRSPAPTTGTLPGADSPGAASHAPRSVWTPRPIPGSTPPDRLPPAPAHTRHRSAWPAATPPISPHHRPGATKDHRHLAGARPDPTPLFSTNTATNTQGRKNSDCGSICRSAPLPANLVSDSAPVDRRRNLDLLRGGRRRHLPHRSHHGVSRRTLWVGVATPSPRTICGQKQ